MSLAVVLHTASSDVSPDDLFMSDNEMVVWLGGQVARAMDSQSTGCSSEYGTIFILGGVA